MKKNFMLCSVILLGIISLVLDMKDIPTRFNLCFNLEYWNVYIIVTLFIIGYYLIDKKTLDKETNKKSLLEYLIKDTYVRCFNMLNATKGSVVHTNKLLRESKDINKLEDLVIYKEVYKNNELIYELIKEGIGEKRLIEDFFNIQSKYIVFICELVAYNVDSNNVENLIDKLIEELGVLLKQEQK